MTAIAVVEQTVAAPLTVAFARFIDFAHWDLWMPETFAPVVGPARALQAGDKFKVGFGQRLRLALELEVVRLRPDKEICWRGGRRLLLEAEHSFMFATDAGNTRIRSEEPLTGVLTRGPLAARVERAFAEASSALLARFAAYVQRQPR